MSSKIPADDQSDVSIMRGNYGWVKQAAPAPSFTDLDAELSQLPAFGLAAQDEFLQQRGLVGQR